MSDLTRSLPAVGALLAHPALVGLPRGVVVVEARAALAELREGITRGEVTELPDVPARIAARVQRLLGGRVVPVINATGVVVHTNLGRAPWAPEAVEAAVRAMGTCAVEVELTSGRRGGRGAGVEALVRHLLGAEAALVVNNNAAAVLLAITALAAGREVIVSRGELVEIGGSFRVPEVIASCGAVLREVGTTNRTRADDYARAIGPDTGALLGVHPSNFRITGFTERPDRVALGALARAHGVPFVEDLGSGALDDVGGEAGARRALAEGADLVTFSGDKLLGGPQAGLIAGRAALVGRLRAHPLYRALRVDKVTLAGLEATLALHASGRDTPVSAMLTLSADVLRDRAERLIARLRASGVRCSLAEDHGVVGGGSLPGEVLPGPVVVLAGPPEPLAAALRTGLPAVLARVADGAVRLDVRTVPDDLLEGLARAVVDATERRDRRPG